ncbi:hypothetical protein DPMN_106295 [Dreissena polymorpha]|uniref:Uncharacterized protein n=1 Tax=Dreissena polymorpha TaxID=45954 RepID=A0A9D4QIN1_DREPO|nr:hypothetical protein DPMN_106295 [Dreissena polymorpha]
MCNIPATWPDCNRYLEALLDEFCSQGMVANGTGLVQLHTSSTCNTRDDGKELLCDARHVFSRSI